MSDSGPPTGAHRRRSDLSLMCRTLVGALNQLERLEPDIADAAAEATAALTGAVAESAPAPTVHPAAPAVGTAATTKFYVAEENLASSMGHPDRTMAVLGSPAISLWFELATNAIMSPGPEARHVGVGILTHHLGPAYLGETVATRCEVSAVSGRSIVFSCEAWVEGRLVALGVHQRVLLDRATAGSQ